MTLSEIPGLMARQARGWRLSLEAVRTVLRRLGPIDYPVILVGGTNGKGSVACFLHAGFAASGLSVGLTTSPHLCDVRERIVVNGRMLSPAAFHQLYLAVESLDEVGLTYFETLALMAILHFKNARVDLAVVEIGLGGRLDAFNALDPAVSVIASLGLEHTEHLGATLEAIAHEKAGIARPGRPVVLGCDHPALKAEVESLGGRTVVVTAGAGRDCRAHNEAIALEAARLAADAIGRSFDAECFRAAVRATTWRGRFDRRGGRPEIILDAAHNPSAAAALRAQLMTHADGRRVVALVAFLRDKDAAGFFTELAPAVAQWVVTEVHDERARPAAEAPAPEGAIVEPNLACAFTRARELAGPEGVLLIAGSIYLLGEVVNAGLVGPFTIWGEEFGANQ